MIKYSKVNKEQLRHENNYESILLIKDVDESDIKNTKTKQAQLSMLFYSSA